MRNLVSCFILFLLLVSIPNEEYSHEVIKEDPQIYDATVRILINNKTACSAFVISDQLALTAYHCIDGFIPFQYAISDKTKKMFLSFEVFNTNPRVDIALLKGNFRLFKKLPIRAINNGIEDSLPPFRTCGYAQGGKLLCFKWSPIGTYSFFVTGKGYIYPGMSGGPLIDGQGFAVGVNSNAANNSSNCSTLINILEDMGINTEE